jgi:hypothetical protein
MRCLVRKMLSKARQDHAPQGVPFPRLHRRGLIEADRLSQIRSLGFSFPRLHRRGLIEAEPQPHKKSGDKRAFRGFIAAASLKPRKWLCHPLCVDPFRGFIAAASLKRDRQVNSDARAKPFRGFIAAASLKRISNSSARISQRSFPRLHRRGLIEARKLASGN